MYKLSSIIIIIIIIIIIERRMAVNLNLSPKVTTITTDHGNIRP